MNQQRTAARQLANQAISENRPLDWFEALYEKASSEGTNIPWADRVPNPNVIEWLNARKVEGRNRLALKIGSGLGDDSEYLAGLGFRVVAFDISPTAIRMTRERFPDSAVDYLVTDLFDPPEAWDGRFDLVWESYTLQVLPPDLRRKAIATIPRFLAGGGELIVVTRARGTDDPAGAMPWPLTKDELMTFEDEGLLCTSFEDFVDGEDPPVRRFRALFRQDNPAPNVDEFS